MVHMTPPLCRLFSWFPEPIFLNQIDMEQNLLYPSP